MDSLVLQGTPDSLVLQGTPDTLDLANRGILDTVDSLVPRGILDTVAIRDSPVLVDTRDILGQV